MVSSVQVKCKQIGASYVALFDHSQEQRTKVKGFESCASYSKSITYSVNKLADIRAFASSSASCKQHTKAECTGVYFRQTCGYLVGSDSKKLAYWGGGPTNGVGCACGITNTCHNRATKCNCDANIETIQLMDQGYLTDKSVLPIIQVKFGDTGGAAECLYYTLGKLECTEN